MRIAAAATLVAGPRGSAIWHGIRIISGILLVVGLWTPIAGTLVVIAQVWSVFDRAGDPWAHLLLGIMGASLALLGPGFWSVDARLFGWKKIDLPGTIEDVALVVENSRAKILFLPSKICARIRTYQDSRPPASAKRNG
jgi:hypothetical protein